MTQGRLMTADIEIAVSIACPAWQETGPALAGRAEASARAALAGACEAGTALPAAAELSIVLADDALVRALNRDYRKQDKATNVLSFPASSAAERRAGNDGAAPPVPLGPVLLGDVVLAYETVRREAAEQGKSLADHLAHLVIHGTLHLLGYDHERCDEAGRMERLEIGILAGLGIADPYEAPAPGARASAHG